MEIFGKHKWFKWGLYGVLVIVVGFLGVQFGWLDYNPQLSTFIGDFVPKKDAGTPSNDIAVTKSDPLLNKDVFDLPTEFAGKSDAEIDIRVKKYIGRPMEVKGYYVNLSNAMGGGFRLMLSGTTTGFSKYAYCHFDEKWKDDLMVLKKDESVSAKGVISGATDRYVSLKDCELK